MKKIKKTFSIILIAVIILTFVLSLAPAFFY